MKDNKNILLISAFVIGILFIGILIFFRNSSSLDQTSNIDSLSIIQGGNELTVSSDGSVIYQTANGKFLDNWSSEKTKAFFEYFNSNYTGEDETLYASQDQVVINKNGTNYTYSIASEDDEFIDAVTEDAQDEDDNNVGGGGNNNNNPPNSTSPPNPTSTPGVNDTCLYWKISYCVIERTAPPVPTETPIPDPNANVIEATGCGDYVTGGNQNPTIISNTACLPTPTP